MATKGPRTRSPEGSPHLAMTVHHQSHHVAALNGITVQAGGTAGTGLNLSRMAGLEAHRGLESIDRLSNGIDSRADIINNNIINNSSHSNNHSAIDRSGDASTTMPHRSRFMITDILADASSPASLQSQEPPASPPSAPRDLSVRQVRNVNLKRKRDEDSDASHHDATSVSSNGEKFLFLINLLRNFFYSFRQLSVATTGFSKRLGDIIV